MGCSVLTLLISHKSDQHEVFPNNISTIQGKWLIMRVYKMITINSLDNLYVDIGD